MPPWRPDEGANTGGAHAGLFLGSPAIGWCGKWENGGDKGGEGGCAVSTRSPTRTWVGGLGGGAREVPLATAPSAAKRVYLARSAFTSDLNMGRTTMAGISRSLLHGCLHS